MKEKQAMKPEPKRVPWVAAILLALGLAFACGESEHAGSGETHFLARCSEDSCGAGFECLCGVCSRPCATEASCAGLPGAATCVEQADACGAPIACDVGCTNDADCASVGADHRCEAGACRAGEPAPAVGCAEGCETVFGTPEDPALGAVDLSRQVAIGCACDAEARAGLDGVKHCVRRADGRLLLVPWVDFTQSEPLSECTPDETARTTASTDFAACAVRPRAACSVDAFCDANGCGGPEFDENGCARPTCETNADCAPTDECTLVESVSVGTCQTYGGACQCGGILLDGQGSFCVPRPPLGELCDGSNDVRLLVHSGGGFVEDSYAFMNPYGDSVFVVLGTCEYYSLASDPGEWRTGTLSESEAQALAQSVAFERMPEFDAFRDLESCPDAGAQYMQTEGAWVMCTCGCGDGAPAGLTDALSAASAATTAYAAEGTPMEGGAVRVVARPEAEVPTAAPMTTPAWSLSFALEDVLLSGNAGVVVDAGLRIDDASDVTELRRLRREFPAENTFSDYVFVHDTDGAVYGILVRDELPPSVAASVDALRSELAE
jgi:hypothetical protein